MLCGRGALVLRSRNTIYRRVRARAEHTLARMKKNWKALRDYRGAAHTLADTASDTASGIAHLHNLALTG